MSSVDPSHPRARRTSAITSTKSHLERLVDSLLFEGYALYPYTPGATKNATPTPFGIVYPRDYAQTETHAFDRMQMQFIVTEIGAWSPARCASCRPPARSTGPSSARCSSASRRARSPSTSTSSRAIAEIVVDGCPTAAAA